MDVSLLFCYSGGRTADGGIRVIVSETKVGYEYKIMKIKPEGEELYGTLTFNKGG
jgi:hypothetical protein